MEAGYVAALFGFAGVLIGSITSIVVNAYTQKAETKRRMLTSLIETGYNQWVRHCEFAKESKQNAGVFPPETYIINLVLFTSLIDELPNLTRHELLEKFKDNKEKTRMLLQEFMVDK